MKFLNKSFHESELFVKNLLNNQEQFKLFYDHHLKQTQTCFKDYHFRTMQGTHQEGFNFNPFPFLLNTDETKSLEMLGETISTIIEKIIEAFVNGDTKVQNYFVTYKKFLPFFKKVSGRWQTLARYDAMIDEKNQIKFTEFNTSSPGGMLKAAIVNQIIRKYFQQNNIYSGFELAPLEEPQSFENYILKLEYENKISPGTIAFLYDKNKLQLELHEMKERMERIGRTALVAEVNELTYKNNCIYINDKKISTIYNNFFLSEKNLQNELTPWSNCESHLDNHPYSAFFNGILSEKCLLIIGFPAMTLIEDKSIFCFMHDRRFDYLFTQDQKNYIKNHIPYSFLLDTHLINNPIDMKNIIENKNQYVLKIKHSALGLGVFLGSDYSNSDWENLLKKNVNTAFIQERIYGKKFPAIFANNPTQICDANIVFSIYRYSSNYSGFVARISEGNVTNVYSNGMYQPVISTCLSA